MGQIGDTREYTNIDESASKLLAQCPQCQVKVVPKGINSTQPGADGEKHCPNCGQIFGRGTFPTKVLTVAVTGTAGAAAITVDKARLQMLVEVLPAIATDKSVAWSVASGTGTASIGTEGLLQALTNGTITVMATANDVTKVSGSRVITLSNQSIWVQSLAVTGAGDATTITADRGTLQMAVAVLPANAVDSAVVWSVTAGTGTATIDADGLLSAVSNGTVTVVATAHDGSGVIGSRVITLSNQSIWVTGLTVSGADDAITITTDGGTLQMAVAVLPANATDASVTWSVAAGTGTATISAGGLLTAVTDGTVTVTATADDAGGITDDLVITLSNQIKLVTSIVVTGAGSAVIIDVNDGTLQMAAAVLPVDADDGTYMWSVEPGTGAAAISDTGLLTAVTNGTVTVKATANDTSGIVGERIITISNQV